MIGGIVFDLDGTLLDTGLDFPAMRRDLGLPAGVPILEALAGLAPGAHFDRQWAIVREHELAGARRAVVYDGVLEFLAALHRRNISQAILTRNSRESATLALAQLDWEFSQVLTREDAPPKPDPSGLLEICRRWQLAPEHVAFCGDYLFDLEAGRRAGMTTILYCPGELPSFADQADHVLRHYSDGIDLIDRLVSGSFESTA